MEDKIDRKARQDKRPLTGKRVGGALYLHRSALDALTDPERASVDCAKEMAGISDDQFNVVKLQGERVSLLLYEDFAFAAFPALLEANTIDLASSSIRRSSYRGSANPPILHRKELLLSPEDPERAVFERLTQALECLGLFKHTRAIGHRRQWAERLCAAGIEIRGHQVAREDESQELEPGPTAVHRHRTAISRTGLSAPMQALARHNLLNEDSTVFDYGCGQGDDLAALRAAGIRAAGWDPHYFPDADQHNADLVNLGFVLNVIETPEERMRTLQQAFGLASSCLAVAVMLWGKGQTDRLRPYNDGFLTKRGTFQKYFNQAEIKALIEKALGQEAIAVGPGAFFVFRDKLAEQQFLANRHRRARDISHLLTVLDSAPKEKTDKDALLLEAHSTLLEGLWKEMLQLGRLPESTELQDGLAKQIESRLGSLRAAARLAQVAYKPDALREARSARIGDLKVYFALNLFNRRKPYQVLPAPLQRDIRAFFGSYKNAETAGRETLFSVGKPITVLHACEQAARRGLGSLDGDHSLQLDVRLIDRLPAALRVYIGCAEVLYGDVDDADLIKIHIQSGKLTLLKFENFHGSPLPRLKERIKVLLREQDMEFFEYGREYPSPILYMKSRFMAPNQKGYRRQKKFDEALSQLESIDLSGFGPTSDELARLLTLTGNRIKGFSIEAVR